MKIQITVLLIQILLLVNWATSAQENKKPYLVKEFTFSGNGQLISKTSGGSIKVTGSSGSNVKVTMFVRPGNWRNRDEEPSKEALANYTFDIRKDGNTIYAIAENKTSNNNADNDNLSVSFQIEVPQQIATKLHTSGGSITLTHVTGNQELKTSGGSLNLSDIKGRAQAHTSGGSINVAQFNGHLDASTSGGSIHLDEASGNIKARTSGGSIQLKKVAGDIEARTSGGSIKADVAKLGRFLTLHTSGGSVQATIPQGQGLDLDLAGNRVRTTLVKFNGTSETNRVKGSVNGGGIPVKMTTSGGTTELNYRM